MEPYEYIGIAMVIAWVIFTLVCWGVVGWRDWRTGLTFAIFWLLICACIYVGIIVVLYIARPVWVP